MKFIIIEDESLSAKHIHNLLRRINVSYEVPAVLDSVKSAIEYFRSSIDYDIVIADINLSDGISFDIFNAVDIKVPVIFTTAFDEYAIRAFKLNSIDYLLKPVGLDDLQSAIDKAMVAKTDNPKGMSLSDMKYILKKDYKRRFLVKGHDGPIPVTENEIACFVEVENRLMLVNTVGSAYKLEFNIDQLLLLLDPTLFFRINKSVLLHIRAIDRVSPDVNGQLRINSKFLKLKDSYVSREHATDFKIWWKS